jgi:hypothetical protein
LSDVALKYKAEHSFVAEIPPLVLIESLSSFVSSSNLFLIVVFPVNSVVPVTFRVSPNSAALEKLILDAVYVATSAIVIEVPAFNLKVPEELIIKSVPVCCIQLCSSGNVAAASSTPVSPEKLTSVKYKA